MDLEYISITHERRSVPYEKRNLKTAKQVRLYLNDIINRLENDEISCKQASSLVHIASQQLQAIRVDVVEAEIAELKEVVKFQEK